MINKFKSQFLIKWWRGVDRTIIGILLILMAFSMILVTTSATSVASKINIPASYFIKRQFIFLLCGITIMLSISMLSLRTIRILAICGFIFSIFMLIIVKFYGYEVKGARRWISILGISMQPSEFIKPFIAITNAWLLSLKEKKPDFPAIKAILFCYGITATLIIIQPDFGMLITISIIVGIQLFIAGIPMLWIWIVTFIGIIGIIAAYLTLPHVADRIDMFLYSNPKENYQVSKSLLAFEQGGLYGRGPGEGIVKNVIPDSHTDFIFAVAAEEFGGISCLLIAFIFVSLIIKSFLRIAYEKDTFSIVAVAGIITQFAIQSIINMGVNLNLLPTKGMTLPFISYGGSSTLSVTIAAGLLLAITRKKVDITKFRIKYINE